MRSVFVVMMFLAPLAQAQELFYDSCQVIEGKRLASSYVYHVRASMTCEQLKVTQESFEIFSMVLMPASIALNSPGVRSILATELAYLGLTLANPAVLGVTVMGAIGISTMYIVLRQTLKECERMDQERLRRELIRELEEKYGVRSGQDPLLTIKK